MLAVRRLLLASFLTLIAAALGTASPAAAHSGFQSYVYMSVFDDGVEGRVEYPIRDLGPVLGVEFPDDPDDTLDLALSLADDIIAYSERHLDLADADGSWEIVFTGEIDFLDAAGGYLQVPFVVNETFDEPPRSWIATYDGIIESNPERDALFLIEDDWGSATFRNEGEHLLGFSVGNETQQIVIEESSTAESVAEIALLGTNSVDESAIAVLTLIALVSSATVGRVSRDPGAQRSSVVVNARRVATWTGLVLVGILVPLWIIGLSGADVTERFAVLVGAVGVLVAAASRWLDDRRAAIAAAVAGLCIGVLVGFSFVDQLLDRSRTVWSLIGFTAGAAGWIVFVVALWLPLALLLTFHRIAPQIATTVAVIGLVAGTVWAVERAFDLVFKLRTAEFDAANAATQPILVGIVTVVVGIFIFLRTGRTTSPTDPPIADPEVDPLDLRRTETQTTEAP